MSDSYEGCVLACRGLKKQFREGGNVLDVLNGVELDVAAGDRLAIVGASGSGKTTLLQLLGGLDLPTGGEVSVVGRVLSSLGDAYPQFFPGVKIYQVFHGPVPVGRYVPMPIRPADMARARPISPGTGRG